MATHNRESEADSAASYASGTGPGERSMRAGAIIAVAVYLVLISVLVLYGLVKLWPHPTPSGEPKEDAQASSTPAATVSPATVTPSPTASVVATRPTPGTSPASTTASGATASAPAQNVTPSPSPTVTPPRNGKAKLPDPEFISFFGGRFTANIYAETRLLLLVMLAGALGSLMHSLRSLYWYTGNRLMVWSWAAFYFLLPFTGAMLAVIFYFVVRGGFFSPQASFENTSPFGFAALSALVGLFSPQATLKLKEVAETIFTKPGSGTDSKEQETDDTSEADNQSSVDSQLVSGATATTLEDVDAIDGCDVEILEQTPDEDLPRTEGGVG